MAEIRPDTFGLLLFNLAWWQLLRGTERKNILLAAAFSGAALFFSARAAVMIVGMGVLCTYLCARRKDATTFVYLVMMAFGFAAIVLLAYLLNPDRFLLMVRSVYFDPIELMPDLSLGQRVLSVDRFVLLALILLALAAAVLEIFRGKARELGFVVTAASLTQLALIAVDPSPFQYVYGWAALPVLAGIALLGRYSVDGLHAGLALTGSALALALISLSFGQVATGRPVHPGSLLRLTYDAPFAKGDVRQATTPELLMRVSRMERQQGLWNQLALLTEICRRVRGPVLAKFYAHPICLRDARYDWAGLRWPLLEGEGDAPTEAEFEALFADRQPELITWGKRHYSPDLSPWGRTLLKDYTVYDGFALRRDVAARR
jgi:hypothetical protein